MPILRAAAIPVVLLGYVLFAIPFEAAVRRVPRWRDRTGPALARLLLSLLRIRVEAPAPERLSPGALLVANHVSWIDILVVASLRPVRFLAKAEVGGWPLVAAIARAQGVIHVDRARRRSIPPANRAMAEALAAGDAVMLFPEGTTSDAGLLPFRSSHFEAARAAARSGAVPVVPLALSYEHPRAAWIGDDALLPHVWMMLASPPSTCRLALGAPRLMTAQDCRKAAARDLETRVRALLVAQAETLSPSPWRNGPPPCPSSPRSTTP